jgi:hypothetical protein
MQLPGSYALRGVVALDESTPQQAMASDCAIGGVNGATLTAGANARRIGIAVFPPRAAWDSASAIVLIQ